MAGLENVRRGQVRGTLAKQASRKGVAIKIKEVASKCQSSQYYAY